MDDRGQFTTAATRPNGWRRTMSRKPPEYSQPGWQAIGARPDAPPLRTLNFDPAHPREFMTLYRSSPLRPGCAVRICHGADRARKARGISDSTDFLCDPGRLHRAARVRNRRPVAADAADGPASGPADRGASRATRVKATGENGFNLVVVRSARRARRAAIRLRDRMAVRAKGSPRQSSAPLRRDRRPRGKVPLSVPVPGHQRLSRSRTAPRWPPAAPRCSTRRGRVLHRGRHIAPPHDELATTASATAFTPPARAT